MCSDREFYSIKRNVRHFSIIWPLVPGFSKSIWGRILNKYQTYCTFFLCNRTFFFLADIKFLGRILNHNLTFSWIISSIQIIFLQSVGLPFKLNKYIPASTLKLMDDFVIIKTYFINKCKAEYSVSKYITDEVLVLKIEHRRN